MTTQISNKIFQLFSYNFIYFLFSIKIPLNILLISVVISQSPFSISNSFYYIKWLLLIAIVANGCLLLLANKDFLFLRIDKLPKYFWTIFIFVQYLIINSFYSVTITQSFFRTFSFILLLILTLLIIPSHIRRLKLKHLLNTITYIIVLLVIVNIVTALFLPSSFTIWTNRLRGIFDNPNTLGTFNLASMPFLLYAFNINTGLKKAFFTIIISLNILLSLVAFSRASILGIAICLCVYFFFFYRKLFYLSILFMCLTIVIIFSSPLLLELLRLADDPFSMRDRMWEIGLLALKKNIWLGVGFGTTPTITNDIFQFTLRGITDFNLGKRFANIYIEVLVETGILGMFLFLLLIFLMVNQSIKSLKYKIGNEAILVKCYLSLLAGILIHGFFESFILSAGNTSSILFWILTGLCLNPFKFEHLNER